MTRPARHQQEVSGPACYFRRIQPERDRAVQHEERLRAVHVAVRRRGAGPRRDGPLHQREVAARLGRHRLERHHVPARTQQPPLPRWHDVSHAVYSAHVTDLLADATAELYQGDPDDFMARRAELVALARDAGETAASKQIGALRKPTRSAWVVNRLVRADPEVAARLAALAAELRDGGLDGGRIRELTAARAQLVDELTRQALDDLPATPSAVREEVRATLDAALAAPEVAANLGTLVRAAHWAGFGLDPSAAPAPPPPAAKTKKPAPAEPSAERERRHREKIISAERAVADADRTADAANAAERELEDELAQARQQLADARRQAYRAESQQRRAGETLSRLRE